MSEVARIAKLLTQTFEGRPYYGPSVVDTLAEVTADVAAREPLSCTAHPRNAACPRCYTPPDADDLCRPHQ